jgi:Fuc2NAc and GlcNAc transferase
MSFKPFAILGVSAVVAWCLTRWLIVLQLRRRWCLDVPNARSSHAVPTPRLGGIGIFVGIGTGVATAWLWGCGVPHPAIILSVLLVATVGFADDIRSRPVLTRLSIEVLAAAGLVYCRGGLPELPLPEPCNVPLGILSAPIAVLWLVAVANIYNFLDGMDGFAAVQGCICGLGAAFLEPNSPLSTMGFAIAGGCLGFLLHNWHPAKMFMGDVGALGLGFALAALPFQLHEHDRSASVFCIGMFLWFFLTDGVVTIFCRLLRGEKIWTSHRSHLYQQLVTSGLRQECVTARVMIAASVVAVLAVAAYHSSEPGMRWALLLLAVASFAGYWIWTRRLAGNPRPADYHKAISQ